MTTQELLQNCTVEGNIIRLPNVVLARPDYLAVAKQLELIGGKWKGGKTKGFVFESDPTKLLDQLASGQPVENPKKKFQFFATPQPLAQKLVAELPATIPPDFKILEPSAGDGALIKAIHARYGKAVPVDCYELMDLNRRRLFMIDGAIIRGSDFLTDCTVTGYYDAIVANPPFTKNQDIDHIRKMYEVCKPGGTIVTLASPSWTFGSQKKQVAFRDWLKMLDHDVEQIPEGAFKESGTMVRSVLIYIRKDE